MMNTCEICGREAVETDLCRYHKEAHRNLLKSYDEWREASGIAFQDYMVRLLEIDETGRWVRDVIEHIKQADDP